MISLIVCTHNRSTILGHCLKAITENIGVLTCPYEVVIIDNDSTDSTKELVAEYKKKYLFIEYSKDTTIGLSHARNSGAKISKYEWLVYIDDDCKTEVNFFTALESTIAEHAFDAFTGVYYPWYLSPKPLWVPSDFGKKQVTVDTSGYLEYPDSFSGGILALKKAALKEVGYFSTNLGMQGRNQGYGEEIYLQDQLKKKGFLLGINPNWTILHLVRDDKFKVQWHLKKHYASGRDHAKIHNSGSLLRILLYPPYRFLKALFSKTGLLFSSEDYFWQNYVIDLFSAFYKNAGILKTRLDHSE